MFTHLQMLKIKNYLNFYLYYKINAYICIVIVL